MWADLENRVQWKLLTLDTVTEYISFCNKLDREKIIDFPLRVFGKAHDGVLIRLI